MQGLGSGCVIKGLGLRGMGLEFRVLNSGFKTKNSGLMI